MVQTAYIILGAIFGTIITIFIMRYPHLGVIFTVASLPIIELLPAIPVFSSIMPIVGGLTLVALLLTVRKRGWKTQSKFGWIHIFGLLFILWMFLSNPTAAWSGRDRNWVFTFVQLWVLMFLAGELLDTPEKQQLLMWVFALISVFSAFFAIQQGYIGETHEASIRATGFVDNANAAARYFTVAMVFLSYLRAEITDPFPRFLTLVGIIITYLGVFFTASRSGMVLIFAAQALLILFQTEIRKRARLTLIFSIGLVGLFFLASNVINILETILPTVIEGSDTMGLRYDLWTAAWRMFKEKPITGVGIGVYRWIVPQYSQDLFYIRNRNIWVHNTYIQILAETGIVGFVLFMGMFITASFNFLRAKVQHVSGFVALRDIWLIVFLVMLLGGITKSDHADKFTWMVMGLSTFFIRQSEEAKVDSQNPSLSSPALPVDSAVTESHP